ncbi:MAG: hypothetical protein J5I90_04690 [Caldilineales bacterium]|nr:hypothetical protein [Caldilineales bacterium]
MAAQMVYYTGIKLRQKPTHADAQQEVAADSGYLIPSELLTAISSRDTQNAVAYVLGRSVSYQNQPQAAANESLAVVVSIYDRLGGEDAFRFFKEQWRSYACCAEVLEILTDLVLDAWPAIPQQLRVDLLTALLGDVSVKSWSLPDDMRIDTGYKLQDRPPNIRLALEYHPVEMMIVHDMLEKLRSQTELAYYQEELGSLDAPPEWAKDFAQIELRGLSGTLRSVLRREKRYRAYADWRRGTGFGWKTYRKPNDELTNIELLKPQEYAYDYNKEVLTRSHNRDETKYKADKKSLNYYRYVALKGELTLHELDKKYIVGSINITQRDELFEIMSGNKTESHYDMERVKKDYDELARTLRISNLTQGFLRFLGG